MMELSFCEKTPSFPRTYETSPIPIIHWSISIHHHQQVLLKKHHDGTVISWKSTMMELSFREKAPSFPRKYETSPIPNIIDQLVFITRNIYHHENNCCPLSSKNLFPKFTNLSYLGLVETSFMLAFDLWLWHTQPQTYVFSYDPPYSWGNKIQQRLNHHIDISNYIILDIYNISLKILNKQEEKYYYFNILCLRWGWGSLNNQTIPLKHRLFINR